MNVIARLDFELAYYDSEVHRFNYTGLQRNWDKHKNSRYYLIWGCWIQIWNPFLLITSSFLDMQSVYFVHIRYIKVYMNSGLILIFGDLWLIF